ncbi:hypothetical protein DdX_06115 [Ditylenchus destructor]|uniref:Uncharacterized protein n=1 Tax=Ditylenchus destructor TaxID=166010 RepID=A0AAD4N5M9_9BILA|nr:hypothetical protein DdX_06115 [Ditylenchus destructor]
MSDQSPPPPYPASEQHHYAPSPCCQTPSPAVMYVHPAIHGSNVYSHRCSEGVIRVPPHCEESCDKYRIRRIIVILFFILIFLVALFLTVRVFLRMH